jgi:hypothetical protein
MSLIWYVILCYAWITGILCQLDRITAGIRQMSVFSVIGFHEIS